MEAASGLLHHKPGTLDLFGVHYMVSDHHGFHFKMNQSDLKEILLNVEDAKKSADFVIVSIHAHMPGNWSEVPADFEPVFAHDVINAGADAVLAQGPHQLRGIEIYKGRPIFYSLGNFIFQEDIMQRMEYDLYEQFHLDPRTTSPVDLNGYYDELDFASPNLYQSVVAMMTFGPHGVTEIRLTPIELHKHERFADRGVPTLASPTVARTTLERLKTLSRPFGTEIKIEGTVGFIRPSSAAIAAAPTD
jgi:poly-gamma-glutamate synthesis protein (capsule biosynthesis protein)